MKDALMAEISVIGCMAMDAECGAKAAAQLTPEDFESADCRDIFTAAVCLAREGKPIELAFILPRIGQEQKEILINAARNTISLDSAQYYIDEVRAQSGRRRLLDCMCRAQEILCTGGSLDQARELLLKEVDSGADTCGSGAVVTAGQAMRRTLEQAEKLRNEGKCGGISTGFARLDEVAGVFNRKGYYVIGARSGMGKTALALCMARAAARSDKKTLIFSMEMPANGMDGLGARLLSQETMVTLKSIRGGKYSETDYKLMWQQSSEPCMDNLLVCDDGELTIPQIRAIIRRLRPDIVYLDYLSLIKADKADGRRVEVDNLSHGLRATAKIYDIPLITLVQLNREAEKDKGKVRKPTAGDIRESDAIYHDADMVMFLFREGQYAKNADETSAELIIDKNRQGPNKKIIPLKWFADYVTFTGVYAGVPSVPPPKPTLRPIPKDVELL